MKSRCGRAADAETPTEAGFYMVFPSADSSELVGRRRARHEIIQCVLGDAEPQHFLGAKRLPRLEDFLEPGILLVERRENLVGRIVAGLEYLRRERQAFT